MFYLFITYTPCRGHSPGYNITTKQNIPLFSYQYHLFLYSTKCVSIKHHYNQKTSPFLRTSLLPFTLLDSYFQLSDIFLLGTLGIYFKRTTTQMETQMEFEAFPQLASSSG